MKEFDWAFWTFNIVTGLIITTIIVSVGLLGYK
jgi:hypothetical protein